MSSKGKQGTKGQKQIVTENKSTLNFYLCIISVSSVIYYGCQYFLFWNSFSMSLMFIGGLATSANLGALRFMQYMGRARYGEGGVLLDGGIDLNMESGMSEHAKDLILLTSILQVLTLVSSYFWLLWLIAPGWAFYLLWVNILGPWFFQPAPEENEKKIKKKERKMRRQ